MSGAEWSCTVATLTVYAAGFAGGGRVIRPITLTVYAGKCRGRR